MIRHISLFLLALAAWLQTTAGGYVYLSKDNPLFYVEGDNIYSPDGKQLLYFKKGNIFFTGETDTKQNIFLLTTSIDVTSDNLQMVYEKDSREASYSFKNRKLFAGKPESEDFELKNELLHMERTGKWWAFYASATDSLIGYYEADSLPLSTAVITAYTLAVKFSLQDKVQQLHAEGPFVEAQYVSIKPIWGNVTANEWIWDGKFLRPRWNMDPRCVWTFDGRVVRQEYVSNIYEQYEWDGENFKPMWRTNRNQEWTWDGRIMKPAWSTDWATQYMIDNRIIKPWSNVHSEREWQVDGDIPIPLMILVISGIARPF